MKVRRSRNWILTNNYKNSDPILDTELLDTINNIPDASYTAFQLERGELDTKHHQIYIHFKNAKSFESIKNVFPLAHIEEMKGSSDQAIEYCTKDETRIHDYVIWGEMPEQGRRNDWIDIHNMINDGCKLYEIRSKYPSQYIRYRASIIAIKNEILSERFCDEFRYLFVAYISDVTGAGKSRYVLEKYGYENVFRVSNYKNPFDSYSGEDVIVFEEFRESIPIGMMLQYLDGYPMKLPARYFDKVACYTKVYILSNISFEKQYARIKKAEPKTYDAWLRRISCKGDLDEVKEYELKNLKPKEEYVCMEF